MELVRESLCKTKGSQQKLFSQQENQVVAEVAGRNRALPLEFSRDLHHIGVDESKWNAIGARGGSSQRQECLSASSFEVG